MFTVCPKCALTLVVTAADLRVAQGYVRCGRCSSVFNALARLTDDRQAAEAMSEAAEPTAASGSPQPAAALERVASSDTPAQGPEQAAAPAEAPTPAAAQSAASAAVPPAGPAGSTSPAMDEEEAIPEAALEFDPATTDVTAVFVEPAPDPEWTAATGSFKALVGSDAANAPGPAAATAQAPPTPSATTAQAGTAAQPSTPAESPTPAGITTSAEPSRSVESGAHVPPAATAVSVPGRAVQALHASCQRPGARHSMPHGRPRFGAAANAQRSSREELTEDRDSELLLGEPPAAVRIPARVWGVAAAIAALALLAQIVHHYRDELATTALLARPLTALYAKLGTPLVPRWDLHAYDVRQLGASVDPASAGLITVRASVKNAAQQPQPMPLLRVTLQDRFGNRIAARDVKPGSYLPRTVPASSLLAAGQRIDAEIGFVDPGASAVGFEIDACLPARGGGVTCANDSATR